MPDTAALLYASLCLIWGSTWLAIKIGLEGVPPFLAAGLRFLLSTAVLFGLLLVRRTRIRLTRDDKISILACAVNFTVSYACVYWSEQYISSGLTALLYSTMPILVALLGHFWTKTEVLTAQKTAGILVGMTGTAILFSPFDQVSGSKVLAMLAALTGSLVASANLVMMKKHARHTDIYVLNALGMALATAGLMSLSLVTESYAGLAWSRANVLAVVYLALVGTVAAFLAYTHLIKEMEATHLSLITLIVPLVAVTLGWIFLKETVTIGTLLGMVTVLAGVAITVGPAASRLPPAQP